MADIDTAIDHLFQGPLEAFTDARNALAKAAKRPDVKALAKPSLPAWAVNQVYWHHRQVIDRLVTASEAVRAAHERALAGESADIAGADQAHREALREAAAAAKAVLTGGGHALTPGTLDAIRDTLQALPSPDANGRLSRPLAPRGLEALAGLVFAARVPGPAAAPPPSRARRRARPLAPRRRRTPPTRRRRSARRRAGRPKPCSLARAKRWRRPMPRWSRPSGTWPRARPGAWLRARRSSARSGRWKSCRSDAESRPGRRYAAGALTVDRRPLGLGQHSFGSLEITRTHQQPDAPHPQVRPHPGRIISRHGGLDTGSLECGLGEVGIDPREKGGDDIEGFV